MTLSIGLTGGIGSGKTTVAKLFAAHGVPVIDMDEIAHAIVTPGQPALGEIVEYFGDDILQRDGQLDRKKLREMIFADAEKRQQLESILHPRIRENARQQLNQVETPYCIIVIPLLFETGQNDLIQRILLVDTTEELQIARTVQRDKNTHQQAEKIIQAQASRATKLTGADDIIENSAVESALQAQVENLHKKYLSLAFEQTQS